MCDAAVWSELKHHGSVVGQHRRGGTATTQHRYFFCFFHISQDGEEIIQASVWLLQLKIHKIQLNNVILWSIDNPAEDTAVAVGLWVIRTLDNNLIFNQNNCPASWLDTHTHTHTNRIPHADRHAKHHCTHMRQTNLTQIHPLVHTFTTKGRLGSSWVHSAISKHLCVSCETHYSFRGHLST